MEPGACVFQKCCFDLPDPGIDHAPGVFEEPGRHALGFPAIRHRPAVGNEGNGILTPAVRESVCWQVFPAAGARETVPGAQDIRGAPFPDRVFGHGLVGCQPARNGAGDRLEVRGFQAICGEMRRELGLRNAVRPERGARPATPGPPCATPAVTHPTAIHRAALHPGRGCWSLSDLRRWLKIRVFSRSRRQRRSSSLQAASIFT